MTLVTLTTGRNSLGVAGGGQLRINDLFKLGLRLGAAQEYVVDKVDGSARNARCSSFLPVSLDVMLKLTAREAGAKDRLFQVKILRASDQACFIQLRLIGKKAVVIFPELPLFSGTASRRRRFLSI